MKKLFCAALVLLMLLGMSGCGNAENAAKSDKNSTMDTAEELYDIDLTQLSSTMVYSEVYNMMVAPKEYIGKTIRMSGNFGVYQDPTTNQLYYACLIEDATACCSQGIEFVLEEGQAEDYPEINETITVSGTFDTYVEKGNLYCRLIHAKLES